MIPYLAGFLAIFLLLATVLSPGPSDTRAIRIVDARGVAARVAVQLAGLQEALVSCSLVNKGQAAGLTACAGGISLPPATAANALPVGFDSFGFGRADSILPTNSAACLQLQSSHGVACAPGWSYPRIVATYHVSGSCFKSGAFAQGDCVLGAYQLTTRLIKLQSPDGPLITGVDEDLARILAAVQSGSPAITLQGNALVKGITQW